MRWRPPAPQRMLSVDDQGGLPMAGGAHAPERRLLKEVDEVSIGVITFYGAQTVEIMKELERLGIMSKSSEGYAPIEDYRMTRHGEERLPVHCFHYGKGLTDRGRNGHVDA